MIRKNAPFGALRLKKYVRHLAKQGDYFISNDIILYFSYSVFTPYTL